MGGWRKGVLRRANRNAQRKTPLRCCIRLWREPSQPRVRALAVIIGPPSFQSRPRLRQRPEQGLVQKLVPEPAVETLDERILRWFPGFDIMPGHIPFLRPGKDRVRGQLGAVVADHGPGLAAHRNDAVQLAGHAGARERSVRDEPQAFPRGIVNHRQDTKPAAIGELIVNKIKAPAIVDPLRGGDRGARAKRAPAAFAPSHAKLFFPVEPEHALVVHSKPLPPQENMQPPVAKPPPLMRQMPEPLPKRSIAAPPRTVAHRHPRTSHHRTRPPLAHRKLCLQMSAGFPLNGGRHHFFASRSFKAALSSIASAKSFFSFTFSSSRARSFLASATSMPPDLAFHLENVAPETPYLRQTSAVFAPASCSFKIPRICSSVNRDRFIVRSFPQDQTLAQAGLKNRGNVSGRKRKEKY